LLVQSVHNVDAEKTAAAASEAERLAAENLAKTYQAVQDELTETKQKLANSEANLAKAQEQLGQKAGSAADLEKRLASAESTVKELV
jgi:ubiquinone biosynthesis protein UbiJ